MSPAIDPAALPPYVLNPHFGIQPPSSSPSPSPILAPQLMRDAWQTLQQRTDYRPTQVLSLPKLAAEWDVSAVFVKDEGQRFGAGGVKALGAPLALQLNLARTSTPIQHLTAIAATDGNHGLALAWAARSLGCQARIYVGSAVDEGRFQRIRAQGAELVRVAGTYDDAVEAAAQAAQAPHHLLISDSDRDGTSATTRLIMAGYSLLAEELRQQLDMATVTHIFLQCGVGGVAAGLVAGLETLFSTLPRIILVEPERAACFLASLMQGQATRVSGALTTRMLGLACGEPSQPAWQILKRQCFAAMSVAEHTASALQQRLADAPHGEPILECGDTGIAGLAGGLSAACNPQLRHAFGIDQHSTLLFLNSEGPNR